MKEKRIEFETAILANSKGFDIETYELDYMVDGNYPGKQGACVSCTTYIKCSTQTLLQKWLREVHNIDCLSMLNMSNEYSCHIYKNKLSINKDKDIWNGEGIIPNGTNYDKVFEEGLFEALKLINDEK